MSTFMWPSLVRGSSVVRGFEGQNISSQKPRTREVLLYPTALISEPKLDPDTAIIPRRYPFFYDVF